MTTGVGSIRGVIGALVGCATAATAIPPSLGAQAIPRTWSDSAIAEFELPLADPQFSPDHIPEDYYYALPERTIWKSYPVYHPDFEPAEYRDSIASLEPEIAFDPSTLATDADRIEAGALVFHAPIAYNGLVRPQDVLDREWYQANRVGVTRDGIVPWVRWVVREQGNLEVGNLSCGMCHTRLMPDSAVIEGAQGNFPFEWITAWRIRRGDIPPMIARTFARVLTATPWIDDPMRDPATLFQLPLQDLGAMRAAVPPGVLIRQGTAFDAPARIPDLIGIRDRKYLDATGLVVHRSPGDLMRYAAANQILDVLARYGDYVPATASPQRPPPGTSPVPGSSDRYSEEQLYALVLYLYSLEAPPNPNLMDPLARRGAEVFDAEGCGDCHTPPLYTNNQLVAAPGFESPEAHRILFDVSDRRVNTDPALATTTRRGTGYYKVPSLKGLWYRGPLQHSGAVATLEDWFDPARRSADYTPTGFRRVGDDAGPVEGHPFGLNLSPEDRTALVAFLRTL